MLSGSTYRPYPVSEQTTLSLCIFVHKLVGVGGQEQLPSKVVVGSHIVHKSWSSKQWDAKKSKHHKGFKDLWCLACGTYL